MRKFIAVLVAVAVLFSAFAFADDLSVLTDEELVSLHQDVLDEMERRYLPAVPETDSELADITERVISFFAAWNRNDPDDMLALCDAGWKATVEDPRTALIGLTAGRTPLDATVERVQEIAGEGPDGLTYELVTLTSHLDKNDGRNADQYRIQLLVRKEEDGFWYVNPSGLSDCEAVEEDFPAEGPSDPEGVAGTASADTVLYYQPDGGEYYHLDQNCLSVYQKYLPLQDSFRYSELNDEPYRNLKPCQVCGAPLRGAARSESMTFRDAVDAAGEFAAVSSDIDYLAVAAQNEGVFFRTVTILDDRAKELYMAVTAAADPGAAYEAFNEYAWSLPVCYTEEITAEEAAAAASVLPIEEYSQKAWPVTAESYSDLQYNLDARYGQVYMIEGVVHQVLSQNPLTVVICTGEDGVSQPVVVECPEQRSFSLEEGESCRIYADVSSALFILPVLTGRYMFYAPFAAPEEAGN